MRWKEDSVPDRSPIGEPLPLLIIKNVTISGQTEGQTVGKMATPQCPRKTIFHNVLERGKPASQTIPYASLNTMSAV